MGAQSCTHTRCWWKGFWYLGSFNSVLPAFPSGPVPFCIPKQHLVFYLSTMQSTASKGSEVAFQCTCEHMHYYDQKILLMHWKSVGVCPPHMGMIRNFKISIALGERKCLFSVYFLRLWLIVASTSPELPFPPAFSGSTLLLVTSVGMWRSPPRSPVLVLLWWSTVRHSEKYHYGSQTPLPLHGPSQNMDNISHLVSLTQQLPDSDVTQHAAHQQAPKEEKRCPKMASLLLEHVDGKAFWKTWEVVVLFHLALARSQLQAWGCLWGPRC